MSRQRLSFTLGLAIFLGGFGLESASAPAAPAGPQQVAAPPAAENSQVVIKSESNLVLVDVIATDKKGNYISDLQKQDFHVYEDDAEQPIASFSHEAEAQPSAPERQHYMVLFFDDSTMDASLQIYARQQAMKFVEGTASTNRQMAVVDFNGTLQIAQNFTGDGELLKSAVGKVKFSSVNPNAGGGGVQLASMGAPSLSQTEGDFGARSMLLSIREVAKALLGTPGRKTMVLFSAGFALTPDRQSELTATIDALNKSNIAVYPIDVRGLVASTPGAQSRSDLASPESPFPHFPGLWAALAAPPDPDPQHGGGGGGGISGGGGGSHGGGAGATGSTGSGAGSSGSKGGGSTNNPGGTNGSRSGSGISSFNGTRGCGIASGSGPNCTNRQIIPTIPDSVSTNQQVLYALAKGTGGFEIFNTNDFLQGLQKVSKEMSEYYNIGYAPPGQTHDGSYHGIKVKVERAGVVVRYRNGYYDVKGPDILVGKPEGKVLEDRVASAQEGEIPVSLSAPYFYVEPGVARVNLALSVPGSAIDFDKVKGGFKSTVNVLGIAYRPNGSIAARFSDTVKLDYEKKSELKDLAKGSFDYQDTFNIAPGSYTLKIALSAGGEKFGKYVMPLVVEPFTGNDLCIGGPAIGKTFAPVSQAATDMDAALLEEHTPLIFKGMELVPSTNGRFAKDTPPVVYLEVYDPALKAEPTLRLGVLFNIVDRKTNQPVYSSNTVLINEYAQPGNPLVPVGLKLPTDQLQAGDYRVEIKSRDADGNVSSVSSADFSIQ